MSFLNNLLQTIPNVVIAAAMWAEHSGSKSSDVQHDLREAHSLIQAQSSTIMELQSRIEGLLNLRVQSLQEIENITRQCFALRDKYNDLVDSMKKTGLFQVGENGLEESELFYKLVKLSEDVLGD